MGTAKMPDVVNGYKWELYNLAEDYSENNDLAAKMPDKLREHAGALPGRGGEVQRVPAGQLDPRRACSRRGRARPPGGPSSPTPARCPACPTSDAPSILNKSYTITAEVEIPQGGAEGHARHRSAAASAATASTCSRASRSSLYNFLDLERFRWEGQQALAPGKHTIVFDFTYDGPGFGKGGTGVLTVDGKEVANKKIPHTIPFLMTIDETFDVGVDTRTPVDDKDYQVPFRFTGKLAKLTIKLGPVQLTSDDHQVIRHALANARD